METSELSLADVLEKEFTLLHPGDELGSATEVGTEFTRLKQELCDAQIKKGLCAVDGDDKSKDEELTKQARLVVLYRQIHKLREQRAALCLSGGGIRSASYGLGILQGLARRRLLDKFHYLSTVSGGGYIGSWLNAWIHRHPRELPGVVKALQNDPPKAPCSPEPDPIQYLREYSNYLTPKLGLFSADSWTLFAMYVRNLLVNWSLLVPLLLIIVAIPWLAVSLVTWKPREDELLGALLGQYLEAFVLGLGFAFGALAIGYLWFSLPSSPKLKPYPGPKTWIRKTVLGYPRWLAGISTLAVITGLCLLAGLQFPDPRYVQILLVTAPVLVAYGVLALLHLSGQFETPTQGQFIRVCLLPLAAAGACLAAWWQWRHSIESHLLLRFWSFGVLFYLLGWLFYAFAGVILSIWPKDPEQQGMKKAFGRAVSWGLVISIASGSLLGLLTWLVAMQFFHHPGDVSEYYGCFGGPLFLGLFLLTGSFYVALASSYMTDDDREWLARASGWLLMSLLVYTAISAAAIFGLEGLEYVGDWVAEIGLAGIISGLITLYLGYSSMTSGFNTDDRQKIWVTTFTQLGLKIAATVFAIFIIVALSALIAEMLFFIAPYWNATFSTTLFDNLRGLQSWEITGLRIVKSTPPWLIALLMIVMGSIAWCATWLMDINRFSLHAIYRNRLVRAFLGASRLDRDPNKLSGFDNMDDVEMKNLAPCLDSLNPPGKPRLFHVINMALNLVSGEKLAWQERKADSFTVTPLHCGNHELGYRKAEEYGKDDKREQALSIGTAVTISGAAASPNMGYQSSPAITFLMTLFNVRLGWWLGNPGRPGQSTYRHCTPRYPLQTILWELFGLTDREHEYVYLSDGGHFDNLGLYEMVLRRCRYIVVSDAGRDPDCAFDDLGNAIRKIRIDLGVPIEIDRLKIYSKKSKKLGKYCAIGRIQYWDVDGDPSTLNNKTPEEQELIKRSMDGILLYIKPAICEGEPVDVLNYSQTNPGFPHEPTSDQWFSESQLESYRMLGSHTMNQICGRHWNKSDLSDFVARVEEYIAGIDYDDIAKAARARNSSNQDKDWFDAREQLIRLSAAAAAADMTLASSLEAISKKVLPSK